MEYFQTCRTGTCLQPIALVPDCSSTSSCRTLKHVAVQSMTTDSISNNVREMTATHSYLLLLQLSTVPSASCLLCSNISYKQCGSICRHVGASVGLRRARLQPRPLIA
jgi:hypothetical protein